MIVPAAPTYKGGKSSCMHILLLWACICPLAAAAENLPASIGAQSTHGPGSEAPTLGHTRRIAPSISHTSWRTAVSQALLPAPARHTRGVADTETDTDTDTDTDAESPSANDASEGFDGSPKECPAGCEKYGNCNHDLGRCDCPTGRTGPTCSIMQYPDCMLDQAAPRAWCGTWHPQSCECRRQCQAVLCPQGHCLYAYDLQAACFERANSTASGNPAWLGGSDIPPPDALGITYHRGGADRDRPRQNLTRDEFLALKAGDPNSKLTAVSINECPQRCNLQGACFKEEDLKPRCACQYGFTGTNCSIPVDTCLHKCSGRGTCVTGFCHCQPGFWGRDCSHSEVHSAEETKPARTKLRIYMYQLPMELAWQPAYWAGWHSHDSIYTAYEHFMQQFAADNSVRTLNPWEANMFYIPAMIPAFSGNLGDTQTNARRVIAWVKQNYPFFNRSSGIDHFMWLTNDRGACTWPAHEEPDMANVIKLTHFALTMHGPPEHLRREFGVKNKIWGCFHPLRDVAPPPYALWVASTAAATYGLKGQQPTFRPDAIPPKLLFHAGGVLLKHPYYSMGVRQAVWRVAQAANRSDVLVVDGRVPDYEHQMRQHKYCLAALGHGWGIRLPLVMAQGCVPLIIQDGVFTYFEDTLPYAEFSVRMSKKDIPDLFQKLEAISNEEYLRLRRNVARYWPYFVWDQHVGGMAYSHTIHSLSVRWQRILGGHIHPLRPAHRVQNGNLKLPPRRPG